MNCPDGVLQKIWGALHPLQRLRPALTALRLFSTGQVFRRGHLIALLLLTSLLPACVRREPPADLVILNGQEPESLDPAIVTGIAEMRITKTIFEGLLRLDPRTARPIPGLAEHWDISADGKRYTFFLRTNAAWSSGAPITSADVVYSWMRALSPQTAASYAGQLFYIKNAEAFYGGHVKASEVGITATGPHTLQVELDQPLAFFLDLCTFPTLAVVPRQVIEARGDRWLNQPNLPCSGPFQLVAWRLNDKVRVRRNPHYWDAANTQSELVDILPVASANVALNLYETGVADIVWDKDLVPVELLDILVKRRDFHAFNYLGTYFYRFNVTRKPFDDPRVRKAFALVTNKERIVTKLTKGREQPADHYVPDGVANYQSPAGLGFNPVKARQLLAEAGFPGGKGFPHLQYSFFATPRMQGKIAVELQQMWREGLGVEIELRQIERKVFYAQQGLLDYDLSASSWIGDYNDANTFLDMFVANSGNNRTGWKNAKYDELIHRANLETDIQRRAELFRQAETLLVVEESPIVPLYFYAGFNYFDPQKIQGVYQNILDEHPLQPIRKIKKNSAAQAPRENRSALLTDGF